MFTWNRNTQSLNGTWKFCPDPMQRCRRQQWWKNPPVANSFFPCWDRYGLWDIEVPGTWKTQFEELKWFDGHAVYLHEFEALPADEDEEIFLCFDGAIYSSEVYLNGQFVGKHDWGYSPFQYRVTELIGAHNQLFVLIDNHLKKDRVPGEIFDWNNDGGITGGVKLIRTPKTHITNFRTAISIEGESTVISVDVEAKSRDINATVEATISFPELDLHQSVILPMESMRTVSFTIETNKLKLWSPGAPYLYDIEIKTPTETLKDSIGLRQISTSGHHMLLNQKPLRLYGLSTHSEFPSTGRTPTTEGIQKMIEAIKDLGANFLRCAHYPYSEEFGRAMDRAGILWWEEVPAYWLHNMADKGQTEKACGMLEEMIRRDWNRASIIIWSISNECCYINPEDPTETNYPYWFKAAALVKKLDSSRLISCAEAGNMISVNPIWNPDQGDEFNRNAEDSQFWRPGHTDEWYNLIDVFAANIYVHDFGEAAPAYTRYVNMFKKYNKPLILSEFGSMSLRNSDVDEDTLGSETRHANLLREAFNVFKELPLLTGYAPWSLTDIRVPLHWRWYVQGKGLFRYGFMDENWQKKEAYSALKESISEVKELFGEHHED